MIINDLFQSASISNTNELNNKQNEITTKYGSYLLSQVRNQLQQDSSLSAVKKYLLNDPEAYTCLLILTCEDPIGSSTFRTFSDAPQLAYAIYAPLNEAENLFIDTLVSAVLAGNNINLANGQSPLASETLIKAQIVNELKGTGVDLDQPDAQVMDAYQRAVDTGAYNYMVECFLNTGEVNIDEVTEDTKNEMAIFLTTLNLNHDMVAASIGLDPVDGRYKFIDDNMESYMSLAWVHALQVASGDNDPISQVYGQGLISNWSYNVDLFEAYEPIQIITENIQAAGALFYAYCMDVHLGIFDVAQKLTDLWSNGTLKLSQRHREATTKLYRYDKKLKNRMTREERHVTYKQVFGLGEVSMLGHGVENKEFPNLFDGLLNQVVEFVEKTEGLEHGHQTVSTQSLSQATALLQYNATEHCTGKPLLEVMAFNAWISDCIELIRDPDIGAQITGGSSHLWGIIDTVHRNHLGGQINVSAAKHVTVEGNKIFQFLSGFNHARRNNTDFSPLLDSCESYILHYSQLSSRRTVSRDMPNEFQEDFAEVIHDDFENWD